MWQVLPHLARQVGNAIRAAGGGKKGLDKVRKANPSWFKNTKTTTKPKVSSAPKGGKSGFTEIQLKKYREMYKNRNTGKAWGNLSQSIKDKLLK